MFEYLQGKKTYILAGLGAVAAFVHFLGWIDTSVFQLLLGLLGFSGMATIRAGIARASK